MATALAVGVRGPSPCRHRPSPHAGRACCSEELGRHEDPLAGGAAGDTGRVHLYLVCPGGHVLQVQRRAARCAPSVSRVPLCPCWTGCEAELLARSPGACVGCAAPATLGVSGRGRGPARGPGLPAAAWSRANGAPAGRATDRVHMSSGLCGTNFWT